MKTRCPHCGEAFEPAAYTKLGLTDPVIRMRRAKVRMALKKLMQSKTMKHPAHHDKMMLGADRTRPRKNLPPLMLEEEVLLYVRDNRHKPLDFIYRVYEPAKPKRKAVTMRVICRADDPDNLHFYRMAAVIEDGKLRVKKNAIHNGNLPNTPFIKTINLKEL